MIGADYALIVTPYYNKPSQKGLIEHYTKIADSVDIPQILYNVPSRTACDLLPGTSEILSEHKNIIGIKEAVNDEERIKDLIKISLSNDSFKIYSGDDPSFLKMLSLGGHGVISVAANVVPRSISSICTSYQNNELIDTLKSENQNLKKIINELRQSPHSKKDSFMDLIIYIATGVLVILMMENINSLVRKF